MEITRALSIGAGTVKYDLGQIFERFHFKIREQPGLPLRSAWLERNRFTEAFLMDLFN